MTNEEKNNITYGVVSSLIVIEARSGFKIWGPHPVTFIRHETVSRIITKEFPSILLHISLTLRSSFQGATGISGTSGINGCSGNSGSVPRLGFPGFCLSDGPAGVKSDLVNGYPAGVSMGASWNRELVHQRGVFKGAEFARKGGRQRCELR